MSKRKTEKQNLMLSLSIPKIKLSILEAQDFERDLISGLQERIGRQVRPNSGLLDLDIKLKGVPFLELSIERLNVRYFQSSEVKLVCLFLKEMSLVNLERKRDHRKILKSACDDLIPDFEPSCHHLIGPEDEDMIGFQMQPPKQSKID